MRILRIASMVTIICLVLMSQALHAQPPEASLAKGGGPQDVRSPAVSGLFYPSNRLLLQRQVDNFLRRAKVERPKGSLVALIAPHAGYIYSGQVAAYSYKLIEGLKFDTVVLIGPSHRYYLKGVSVYNHGYYKTPLGIVQVDSDLATLIIEEDPSINFVPAAHTREHSLEVQLPFLQRTLRDFKVVPILISDPALKNCRILAEAISKNIKDKSVLIVASTDLSHYQPYDEACRLDRVTLESIAKLDPEEVASRGDLCGKAAVMATILIAKELQATGAKILKYKNSGDTAGPKDGVVGYGAVVIYKSRRGKGGSEKMTKEGWELLDAREQEELLRIARSFIETYVRDKKVPEITTQDPKLKEKLGVFVTLKKEGMLRGCIGYIQAVEPLYKAVSQMAVEAATRDYRFLPVRADELKHIDIEISVLSPLKQIASVDEIELGRHGVVVRKGLQQGVFLPQVAEETGWSKAEFLSHLCRDKAGLPEDAWKGKDLAIYIFTVQKFEERKEDCGCDGKIN